MRNVPLCRSPVGLHRFSFVRKAETEGTDCYWEDTAKPVSNGSATCLPLALGGGDDRGTRQPDHGSPYVDNPLNSHGTDDAEPD